MFSQGGHPAAVRPATLTTHCTTPAHSPRIPPQGPGIPPQTGREAVMSWLAAVADANAARLGGGEMGALRSVGLGE